MAKITKDTTIGDVLEKSPDKVKILFKHGLHCIGCSIANQETLEEAASAHSINLKVLLKELNE
jgi:hybrid cluster-associated redox disulfide protein